MQTDTTRNEYTPMCISSHYWTLWIYYLLASETNTLKLNMGNDGKVEAFSQREDGISKTGQPGEDNHFPQDINKFVPNAGQIGPLDLGNRIFLRSHFQKEISRSKSSKW